MFCYSVIFWPGFDRLERPPAIPIKVLEKFQTLQAHIMDIAAQQVQGKVKGIAQKGKCKEDDEIAGDGRQGIEYLCDDRTGISAISRT